MNICLCAKTEASIIEQNKNNYIVYTQPFMSTPMKSVTLLKHGIFLDTTI